MTAFHMPFLPPEAVADDRTLAAVADEAVNLARRGDARAALALVGQARQRAQGLEMERGELAALNAAAIVHLIRGDAIAAIAASLDACQMARRLHDRSILGHAGVTLDMAAFVLGAREDIAPALRQAIERAVEAGDRALEIRARVALGVVLGDAGRFEAAEAELARALAISRLQECSTGPARITANLANLHRKRARAAHSAGDGGAAGVECDVAAAVAERACRLAAAEGSVAVEIDALGILGCVRSMQGRTAEGLGALQRAAALGRARRCRTATVWILCELGALMLDIGDVEGAQAAYREALDAATEVRPSPKIALACEGLARVARARGDAPAARQWSEEASRERSEFERLRRQARSEIEVVALAA